MKGDVGLSELVDEVMKYCIALVIGEHGEELAMWKDIKDKIPLAAEAFNDSSANVLQIRDQDKRMAEKKEKNGKLSLRLLYFSHPIPLITFSSYHERGFYPPR